MNPPRLTSPLLNALPGIRHGFFTRQGGVSQGLYASLNLGRGSRDHPAAVEINRARVAASLGVQAAALNTCWQIHSSRVVMADTPWGEDRPQADGVVTSRPALACAALAADCAPVLLADAEAGVVAAVHAGWRGALNGVIGSAVQAMAGLGAEPSRLVAVVGPCIGPQSYEVGPEFFAEFIADAPESKAFFTPGDAVGKSWFNLPGFVLDRLARAGVTRCEWIGRDTFAEPELFYSNRRAFKAGEDDYGRLMSAIVIDR